MVGSKIEYILCSANHYTFTLRNMRWYEKLWYRLFPPLKHQQWLRNRGISPSNITEGIVLCGWRHTCIIAQMNGLTGLRQCQVTEVQGFLTNKNRFVDRVEGMKIAKAACQVREGLYHKQLFSEDLY